MTDLIEKTDYTTNLDFINISVQTGNQDNFTHLSMSLTKTAAGGGSPTRHDATKL